MGKGAALSFGPCCAGAPDTSRARGSVARWPSRRGRHRRVRGGAATCGPSTLLGGDRSFEPAHCREHAAGDATHGAGCYARHPGHPRRRRRAEPTRCWCAVADRQPELRRRGRTRRRSCRSKCCKFIDTKLQIITFRLLFLFRLALCCTVLRSRWCQSGIRGLWIYAWFTPSRTDPRPGYSRFA